MRRAVRQRARVAVLALVTLAHGCRERTPPAEEAPAARPTAQRRVGVKVPMPEGWTAQVAQDGSFQFGPPGHPVLRVDLRPGEGDKLPSPDGLAETLLKPFAGFAVSLDQEQEGEDFSLLWVTLAPRLEDGGPGEEWPALFGAKRVAGDLFLCATLPGASAEEVRQAADACRGIEFQPQPPR
jgi:hypothetical protein